MSTTTLSVDQLKRAVAIAEQIQQLETELASVLGGSFPSAAAKSAPAAVKAGKKKRTMSPEARAKIVAAQKARWAKIKAGEAAAPARQVKPTVKAKVRRKISAEGRAKMAAAAKKRWADKKAAKA